MGFNHRLIHQALAISAIGASLFGCISSGSTPSSDQMDWSPFTGIPCVAPCWQNLIIGESNEDDVLTTLPTLPFINQETIYVHQMLSMPSIDPSIWAEGTEITASCIQPDKSCLTLRVVDDVLTEIVIALNYEINVDNAVGYLGSPDYIGYGMLGAERIICEVYLIWSEKQLVLASEKFEGFKETENTCGVVRDTGKAISSLIISEARYMSVKGIEFMISRGYNQTFEYTGTIPEQ